MRGAMPRPFRILSEKNYFFKFFAIRFFIKS